MLFYSKLISENKTYGYNKFLTIMPRRFSNDLFALKKCPISNKQ